jgi:hypothetical protein
MASIASLLNPEPNDGPPRWPRQNPTTTLLQASRLRDDRSPPPPRQKKQKLCKDGAVWDEKDTRGEIRYPACENQDGELAAAHRELFLEPEPITDIMKCPRHIPYNSEKKSFLEKTGRESFEGKSPGGIT